MMGWSRRKLFAEARRRCWLVAICVVLVTIVAWAVSATLPESYSAESAVVVLTPQFAGAEPDESIRLAANYAVAVPLEPRFEAALRRRLNESGYPDFSIANDPGTAVLRLNFDADNPSAALAGARTMARLLSEGFSGSRAIAPGAVSIVRLPSTTAESRPSTPIVAVGVGMGLMLGLVLVAFWASGDVRVDEVAELVRQLECPCFLVAAGKKGTLEKMTATLRDEKNRTFAIVPCRDSRPVPPQARQTLLDALADRRIVWAGIPGTEDGDESAVAACDAVILFVTPGQSAAAIGDTLGLLARHRANPNYGLLYYA